VKRCYQSLRWLATALGRGRPETKTSLLFCPVGIAFAMLLLCGGALAQCATEVHYGLVHCVDDGKETEVDSDTCADSGPPNWLCVQGYGECTDGTPFYTANAGCSDSGGDCGGGGGDCTPDKCSCGDGTCSSGCCTEFRGRSSSAAAKLPLRVVGGYYRNGTVYDELPFGFPRAKKPTGLAAVLCVDGATLSERKTALEVEP
jgi:hypothetical protein